jgi:hypothetical protein
MGKVAQKTCDCVSSAALLGLRVWMDEEVDRGTYVEKLWL